MATIKHCVAVLCMIFFVGCASGQIYSWQTVHRVVTPQISAPKAGGFLLVHTEKVLLGMPGSEDRYYAHLPYALYDPNGKFVKSVENHADIHGEEPALTPLIPGKYVIVPDVSNTRREIVGVIIENGKTTEVKLNGK